MRLKCKVRIFFVILVLFLCDICIAVADDAVVWQDNDVNIQQVSSKSNDGLDNANIIEDKQGALSSKRLQESNSTGRIITFQINEALNINFDDIKLKDVVELLHENDEYQALRDGFAQQNLDRRKKTTLTQEDGEGDYIEDAILKLSSLYYYNDNNWGCKINDKFIKKSNQNNVNSNVSIVKINKDSILFVLNKTKEKDIEKIRKLKKTKYKYSSDYYIVKNGTTKSLMFRLYIGQSIDLNSFEIK